MGAALSLYSGSLLTASAEGGKADGKKEVLQEIGAPLGHSDCEIT